MRHVVWDWNGTLLDDLPLVVESVNVLMRDRGLDDITAAQYTAAYTRPVRVFYERLFGRTIDDAEWATVDEVFHAAYDREVAARSSLMSGARRALRAVDDAGLSQSLLSMYRHEPLVGLVDHFSIGDHFEVVQGITGEGGGHKLPHLEHHLERMVHLHGEDPGRIVLIGDALDDAVAAEHVGARCVLLASGSHPRSQLETAGFPVVESLDDALAAGGIIA